MPVGRRVYGWALDEDFFKFRDRAKREGLTIEQAMTAIVRSYAEGLVLVRRPKVKVHAKSENGFPTERAANGA